MNELERYNWGVDMGDNNSFTSLNFIHYLKDNGFNLPITYSSMDLDEFQDKCRVTAIYPTDCSIIYPILGLIGEVMEVAEKARDYLFPAGAPKNYDETALFLKEVYHSLDDAANLSAGKTSKVVRDKNGTLSKDTIKALKDKVDALTDEQKSNLVKENLDCVWFIMTSLQDMGTKFSDAAQALLDKLNKRKIEGKLSGEGDSR